MHHESLSSSVSSRGREPPSKIRKFREESHDRAAWRVVKKRLAIEVQTTVACGRHSMKFLGPLDAFQKQKRVERSFSRKT